MYLQRFGVAPDDVLWEGALGPAQILNWTKHAHLCAYEITTQRDKAPHGSVAIFWVRLYGILKDLDQFLEKRIAAATKPDPEIDAHFAKVGRKRSSEPNPSMVKMRGVIAELRKLFDDDDLLWLEYRRHVDAHPFQNAYSRLDGQGKDRTTFKSKLLGNLPLVDVKRRLQAFIAKRQDERLLAVHFATRAVNHLAGLAAVAVEMDAPVRAMRARLPR